MAFGKCDEGLLGNATTQLWGLDFIAIGVPWVSPAMEASSGCNFEKEECHDDIELEVEATFPEIDQDLLEVEKRWASGAKLSKKPDPFSNEAFEQNYLHLDMIDFLKDFKAFKNNRRASATRGRALLREQVYHDHAGSDVGQPPSVCGLGRYSDHSDDILANAVYSTTRTPGYLYPSSLTIGTEVPIAENQTGIKTGGISEEARDHWTIDPVPMARPRKEGREDIGCVKHNNDAQGWLSRIRAQWRLLASIEGCSNVDPEHGSSFERTSKYGSVNSANEEETETVAGIKRIVAEMFQKLRRKARSGSVGLEIFVNGLRSTRRIIRIGFQSLFKILKGEMLVTLEEIYCYLHIAYAMYRVENAQSDDKYISSKFRNGLKVFEEALSSEPHLHTAIGSSPKDIFREIVDLMWEEIEGAMKWIERNCPQPDNTVKSELLANTPVDLSEVSKGLAFPKPQPLEKTFARRLGDEQNTTWTQQCPGIYTLPDTQYMNIVSLVYQSPQTVELPVISLGHCAGNQHEVGNSGEKTTGNLNSGAEFPEYNLWAERDNQAKGTSFCQPSQPSQPINPPTMIRRAVDERFQRAPIWDPVFPDPLADNLGIEHHNIDPHRQTLPPTPGDLLCCEITQTALVYLSRLSFIEIAMFFMAGALSSLVFWSNQHDLRPDDTDCTLCGQPGGMLKCDTCERSIVNAKNCHFGAFESFRRILSVYTPLVRSPTKVIQGSSVSVFQNPVKGYTDEPIAKNVVNYGRSDSRIFGGNLVTTNVPLKRKLCIEETELDAGDIRGLDQDIEELESPVPMIYEVSFSPGSPTSASISSGISTLSTASQPKRICNYPLTRKPRDSDKTKLRISCGIGSCQANYANLDSLRRHRKSVHETASRKFIARCLLSGCQSSRTGTKMRARGNILTHQSQDRNHREWAIGKAEKERFYLIEIEN
ncbi:hypothetical protein TWF225_006594 [Orbilia oligospora]|nr:hypothetical protein TWF225_006594 [Orbilia oligospora]KAF3265109.1 hypothetical protein TWF217_002759 [Orbilia oligospora]KAF3268020.1 hypothetical protein TWF128_008034 [Orbilia oligospora]